MSEFSGFSDCGDLFEALRSYGKFRTPKERNIRSLYREEVKEEDMAEQPIVYISGPIKAENYDVALANIVRAEELAFRFYMAGFPVVCVHSQARVWYNQVDAQGLAPLFVAADQACVARCDVVAMVEGWEHSDGSKAEIQTAQEIDLPILYTDEDQVRFMQLYGLPFID